VLVVKTAVAVMRGRRVIQGLWPRFEGL
jgi:hypothetical protein